MFFDFCFQKSHIFLPINTYFLINTIIYQQLEYLDLTIVRSCLRSSLKVNEIYELTFFLIIHFCIITSDFIGDFQQKL